MVTYLDLTTSSADGYVFFGLANGTYLNGINYISSVNNDTDMTGAATNGNYVFINTTYTSSAYSTTFTAGQLYKYVTSAWVLYTPYNNDTFILNGNSTLTNTYIIVNGIYYTTTIIGNSIISYWDSTKRLFGNDNAWQVTIPSANTYMYLSGPATTVKFVTTWNNWTFSLANDITQSYYLAINTYSVIQEAPGSNNIIICRGSAASNNIMLTFDATTLTNWVSLYGSNLTTLMAALAKALCGH